MTRTRGKPTKMEVRVIRFGGPVLLENLGNFDWVEVMPLFMEGAPDSKARRLYKSVETENWDIMVPGGVFWVRHNPLHIVDFVARTKAEFDARDVIFAAERGKKTRREASKRHYYLHRRTTST